MRLRLPRPGPPRVVATTAVVAIGMGAVGWVMGAQVQSPADAAAAHRAPAASLVTVPIERRTLTATVVAQGTVSYGAPHALSLSGVVASTDESGGGDSSQLVTKAPIAGHTLHEGDVLLEVSGRPVFVFTGSVPMYRTLRKGGTGDDVHQLRTALRRLMPSRNLAATGPFNAAVIGAVKAWYQEKGYVATGPSAEARSRLHELQQAVTDASDSAAGTSDSAAGTSDSAAGGSHAGGSALADANSDLKTFNKTYGVSIASGEILFLPKLPTRLNTVTIKAGVQASGPIGTVANPVLVINGTVGSDDADLLKKGLSATLRSTTGASFKATLTGMGASVAPVKVDDSSGDSGGKTAGGDSANEDSGGADDNSVTGTPIRLKPQHAKKLTRFAGQSVKITIRVGGTGQAVLTVPVAAVFTSADGHAQVSVQTGPTQTRDVPISTGLSTGGYVQITPQVGTQLRLGERVVVGEQ